MKASPPGAALHRNGGSAWSDGQAAGLVGAANPIKASTPEAIKTPHREGVRLVMLTGDSWTTAQAVSAKLGMDDVMAEVAARPEGGQGEAAPVGRVHRGYGGRRDQ